MNSSDVLQEPIKRATRIIKGIEEHKVPYNVLLRRRMKSSERASAKAVDEAIMELFQIPDKITERRIKDFIVSNHLETSTLKETLKVYQEVESVRRSVKRFCSMNEVCYPLSYALQVLIWRSGLGERSPG